MKHHSKKEENNPHYTKPVVYVKQSPEDLDFNQAVLS